MAGDLPTLSELVKLVLARSTGQPLDDITASAEVAVQLEQLGNDLVHRFVALAKDEGYSWAQIGTSLGVSRQAVQQRYGIAPGAGDAAFGVDGSRDKLSPFSAARLGDAGTLEVQLDIGGAWHELVELDGRAVADVVAVCRRSFGRRWLKRFSEDLDEVYRELGDELRASVEVVVADPLGRRTRRTVPTTMAKRKAAWTYNFERLQSATARPQDRGVNS